MTNTRRMADRRVKERNDQSVFIPCRCTPDDESPRRRETSPPRNSGITSQNLPSLNVRCVRSEMKTGAARRRSHEKRLSNMRQKIQPPRPPAQSVTRPPPPEAVIPGFA